MVDLITYSPSETQSLGRLIGTLLPKSSILGIDGSLGSGKTCLVQGIALGLGISSDTHVTSPAYTLIQQYPIQHTTLIHIDFYRLDSLRSADLMLFEELFSHPEHIIAVEWASKFLSELVADFLKISISPGSKQNHRIFKISSDSTAYAQVLRRLSDSYVHAGA